MITSYQQRWSHLVCAICMFTAHLLSSERCSHGMGHQRPADSGRPAPAHRSLLAAQEGNQRALWSVHLVQPASSVLLRSPAAALQHAKFLGFPSYLKRCLETRTSNMHVNRQHWRSWLLFNYTSLHAFCHVGISSDLFSRRI